MNDANVAIRLDHEPTEFQIGKRFLSKGRNRRRSALRYDREEVSNSGSPIARIGSTDHAGSAHASQDRLSPIWPSANLCGAGHRPQYDLCPSEKGSQYASLCPAARKRSQKGVELTRTQTPALNRAEQTGKFRILFHGYLRKHPARQHRNTSKPTTMCPTPRRFVPAESST
jgi:hypothetical protein